MEKQTIIKLNQTFEDAVYEQDGIEYWLARDLQLLLGYTEWRNFLNAIVKAKDSCKTTGEGVLDHFVYVNKTIEMPKGATKDIDNILPLNNFSLILYDNQL
jgi:DNA-damage-inducible protein D